LDGWFGSAAKRRMGHRLATVALMGVESAGEPAGLDIARLLRGATLPDGSSPLSDQLAADLDDLLAGAPNDTVVAEAADVDGFAVASRRDGTWTMQVVVEPLDRHRAGGPLLGAILDAIAGGGGGRVDWWVYAPTADDDDAAARLGLRADRDLLRMRRPLPVGRRASVATRSFRPGRDEEAWLAVNNRAFAGHHEQAGWTLETLQQRIRQPWFDPADVRLHERDGRLAAFCWTKRHDHAVSEIYVIGVDPDFQGLGLGTELTLAGLDHMVDRGATEALLYVAADNVAARTMYERLGFVVTRIDRAYVGEVPPGDR
jgi:mycothiol synthase